MPNQIILDVIAGPIKGESFTFDSHDTFIFGREDDCHARLSKDDKTASRHHFLLEANPPAATICDLGSLNGTYINGKKSGGRAKHLTPEQGRLLTAESIILKNGDEIKVGNTIFNVSIKTASYCAHCQNEIPENVTLLPTNGDLLVCLGCSLKLQNGELLSTVRSASICDKCKKDVSGEISKGFQGSYVCISCRQGAEENPDTILELLQNDTEFEETENYGNIDDYEVLEKLGEGGMGAVYLAQRKSDGLKVALKTMLAQVAVNKKARDLFRREIEVTKELNHPNIVKLYDQGSTGSGFFFTLEFCSGGSAMDLMLKRKSTFPLQEALNITLQVLEGLAFAHNHEKIFVHRDIKPPNILLTSENGGVAKLADFGLAKSFQNAGLSGMTATGQKAGSLVFMPREQLTNFKRVKPVSDVWSMAASLYLMLTGETVYEFDNKPSQVEVIMQGNAIPIRNRKSNIPVSIAEVIDQALRKDPKERFQNAVEFKRALEKVL